MKVIDRLIQEELFGVHTIVDGILSYVYGMRIYISDLLYEDLPDDIIRATEYFLKNDVEYDGDEYDAWERFLNNEIEELLK